MLAVDDIREPMEHVFEKYCKPDGQKAYAVGCSLGAGVLTNCLGFDGGNSILSGAACVQAAIKKWEGVEFLEKSLGGFYHGHLGETRFNKIRDNIDVFQPYFMEKHGIDLAAELEKRYAEHNSSPITYFNGHSAGLNYTDYHKLITANLPGPPTTDYCEWEDGYDYLYKCSPFHRVPGIKRPTLFLNSLDDPFIATTLDWDVFKKNPNTVLATNQFAGHLGYHESLF